MYIIVDIEYKVTNKLNMIRTKLSFKQKTTQISNERNNRSINIAHTVIPLLTTTPIVENATKHRQLTEIKIFDRYNIFGDDDDAIFNKERNILPINITTNSNVRYIDDRNVCNGEKSSRTKTHNIILHKSLYGYVLIALNILNEPIKAWRDIDGIIPIKSKLVDKSKFQSILKDLCCSDKINTVYLNDGQPIKAYLREHRNLKISYYNNSLIEIINDLQREQVTKTRNKQNKNKQQQKDIPTYNSLLQLDPTITKKEYYNIINMGGW